MKRFHVHLAVDDLAANIRFYSTVFGAPPTVEKPDYAKWMLDDPRINFAISCRGLKPGLDHLGVQVESEEELVALRDQVERAEIAALDQPGAACCYAKSDKYWVTDPQGVAWETFRTLGDIAVFGEKAVTEDSVACCAPAPSQAVAFVKRPATSKSCC
jgi:catechol 2,3-dioxygenase-like lactoylglutathione lyase family enzyme